MPQDFIWILVSGIIGFVLGVGATLLVRGESRTPPPPRRPEAAPRSPDIIREEGWGRGTVRVATVPPRDAPKSNPAPESAPLRTTAPNVAIKDEAALRDPTARQGMAVAMLTARRPERKWGMLAGDSMTIGRFDDCDIEIEDDEVSRLHAQITHRLDTGESHEFAIFDYTSTNGTLINDKPIKGVASLNDGDVIKIGNTELTFHRIARAADPAPSL